MVKGSITKQVLDQKKLLSDITTFFTKKTIDKSTVDAFLHSPTNKGYCELMCKLASFYQINIDPEKTSADELSHHLSSITEYRNPIKKEWFNPIGVLSSWSYTLHFIRYVCNFFMICDVINELIATGSHLGEELIGKLNQLIEEKSTTPIELAYLIYLNIPKIRQHLGEKEADEIKNKLKQL